MTHKEKLFKKLNDALKRVVMDGKEWSVDGYLLNELSKEINYLRKGKKKKVHHFLDGLMHR